MIDPRFCPIQKVFSGKIDRLTELQSHESRWYAVLPISGVVDVDAGGPKAYVNPGEMYSFPRNQGVVVLRPCYGMPAEVAVCSYVPFIRLRWGFLRVFSEASASEADPIGPDLVRRFLEEKTLEAEAAIRRLPGRRVHSTHLYERLNLAQSLASVDLKMSVEDLANVALLSRGHFSSCFRVAFGLSPARYLFYARMSRAETLLKPPNNSWSITEVAETCGYGDPNAFRRAFKKHRGLAPMRYSQR